MTEYASTEGAPEIPAVMIQKSTGRVVGLFDTWPRGDDYMLAPLARAIIPEGKRQVGETRYRFASTHVDEVVELEDVVGEDDALAETAMGGAE